MLAFLAENLATIIGSLLVLAVFVLIIAKQIKDKRSHKSGCGCNCADCPSTGMCHPK